MRLSSIFCSSTLLAIGFTPLMAAGAHAQSLTSKAAFQIVELSDAGEEQLVDRASVRPGETIQYNLTHTNETEADMSGLAITAPIPEGSTIALGTQTSSLSARFEIQAEMEPENPGLEWSSLPAFRTVTDADGSERSEEVPADAIVAVRWNLDAALMSGETALNSYRVVVD